jgi:excinuclease UvrABC nuclease subunit
VRSLIDALRDSGPVHRCNDPARCHGCAFAQMNACHGESPSSQRAELRRVALGLLTAPDLILEPLHDRMMRLARGERFEEAAEMRRRAALFERSLDQHLQALALIEAGELVIESQGRALLIRSGRLVAARNRADNDVAATVARLRSEAGEPESARAWLDMAQRREARVICSWLNRTSSEARLLYAARGWSLPAEARPHDRFAVRREAG